MHIWNSQRFLSPVKNSSYSVQRLLRYYNIQIGSKAAKENLNLGDSFQLMTWQRHTTAISKHEFLSEFWNCPLVFCSHPLYYAIQALCDIFQCSLCIQRMWIAVSTNKFIWGTNYIQLHYWLRRTSGAIFFLEIRISMAADVGL